MPRRTRFFVCQILPQDVLEKHKCSQAGNNFCRNLISGGLFGRVISMIPCQVKKDVKKECSNFVDEVVQCRVFPQNKIFRVFNALVENLRIVRLCRKADNVWFYNITPHNFPAAAALRFLFRKKLFVLMADFTPPPEGFSVWKICFGIIQKSAGIVSLSCRSDFSHENFHVLPGVVVPGEAASPCTAPEKRTFLFSGSFIPYAGLDMALEVFSEVPEATLLVCGGGENALLKNYTERFPNLRHLGFLSFGRYREVLASVAVGISFRNPGCGENRNNFPSKILEYFNSGKAVLSTMHYPELDGVDYFEAPYNKEALKAKVRDILAMPEKDFAPYAMQAEKVRTFFSPEKWGKVFDAAEKFAEGAEK